MRAIRITSPGVIRKINIPEPRINANEVLLKIEYVGLCGSDLSTFSGRNPLVQYPRIPGHEISGIITEKGKEVPDKLETGKRVTVIPYTSCGNCAACKNGRANACRYNQTLGVQRDGAMADYLAVPWEKIVLTDALTGKESALTEPLTVGFHAVSRGAVTGKDTVMVLGCGMVGTGAIIRSVMKRAEVIAVDIDDNKLLLAQKLGARYTINSSETSVHKKTEEITRGHGPSVVIEAAGNPATWVMAIEEVSFTGRIICIGYVKDTVPVATRLIVQKELDIRGSRNATPADFEAAVSYLGSGTCPVDSLVSRIISPDEVGESMKFWAEKPGQIQKILVRFG